MPEQRGLFGGSVSVKPGGRVPDHKSSAVISDCERYRYRLDRSWGSGPRVCWVMLNPSTADAEHDDATLRKITAYTKRWGYGSLVVVNLFAWRSKDPKALPLADDRGWARAIGPDTDKHIEAAVRESDLVVCGWGVSVRPALMRGRDETVLSLIRGFGAVPTAVATSRPS